MSKYRLLSFMILFRNFFAGLPQVSRGSFVGPYRLLRTIIPTKCYFHLILPALSTPTLHNKEARLPMVATPLS